MVSMLNCNMDSEIVSVNSWLNVLDLQGLSRKLLWIQERGNTFHSYLFKHVMKQNPVVH